MPADQASGLTVRELCGEHIVEASKDKYFEKHLRDMKVQSSGKYIRVRTEKYVASLIS